MYYVHVPLQVGVLLSSTYYLFKIDKLALNNFVNYLKTLLKVAFSLVFKFRCL